MLVAIHCNSEKERIIYKFWKKRRWWKKRVALVLATHLTLSWKERKLSSPFSSFFFFFFFFFSLTNSPKGKVCWVREQSLIMYLSENGTHIVTQNTFKWNIKGHFNRKSLLKDWLWKLKADLIQLNWKFSKKYIFCFMIY